MRLTLRRVQIIVLSLLMIGVVLNPPGASAQNRLATPSFSSSYASGGQLSWDWGHVAGRVEYHTALTHPNGHVERAASRISALSFNAGSTGGRYCLAVIAVAPGRDSLAGRRCITYSPTPSPSPAPQPVAHLATPSFSSSYAAGRQLSWDWGHVAGRVEYHTAVFFPNGHVMRSSGANSALSISAGGQSGQFCLEVIAVAPGRDSAVGRRCITYSPTPVPQPPVTPLDTPTFVSAAESNGVLVWDWNPVQGRAEYHTAIFYPNGFVLRGAVLGSSMHVPANGQTGEFCLEVIAVASGRDSAVARRCIYYNPAPPPGAPAPLIGADGVLQLMDEQNVLDGPFTNSVRANNRSLLNQPLRGLTVSESGRFMDSVRRDGDVRNLVMSLVNVDSSANFNDVVDLVVKLLNRGTVDHLVESLTYTTFHQSTGGYFYDQNGGVHMAAYTDVNILIHETNHSFNQQHGLGGLSAMNEALSIVVTQPSGDKNMAEAFYGTVLFYRDIGINGYPPDVDFGDTNSADAKGLAVVRQIMANDQSKIDWTDEDEVLEIYNLFWKGLNRNQPFDQWLVDADKATQDGKAHLGR